ncbi:MAG: TIGR02757 family protein [Cytophagaceae bacterium]|nr:TIGR02757 family protein [Cytophagaceae bacterium]
MPQFVADLLDASVRRYNQPAFIAPDPISIPHRFSRLQDIEIMGFWAAMLAWGQRKTILTKCDDLINRMDGAPYDFVRNHQESDLKHFLGFKHRTFNDTDALYFLHFFRWFYSENTSLETAFSRYLHPNDLTVERALVGFHELFTGLPDFPPRTRKHVATPARKSGCKRLNMFLRWMVRRDSEGCGGVDFGLWHRIRPAQLVCPCDVHVERVARHLGLIRRKQTDWQTALELTAALRQLDPNDPVKYDFALFGLGVNNQLGTLQLGITN